MSKFVIQMIESERGWGQRVDEELEFDTKEEADKYADEYNAKYNNQARVPDWYIYAHKCY